MFADDDVICLVVVCGVFGLVENNSFVRFRNSWKFKVDFDVVGVVFIVSDLLVDDLIDFPLIAAACNCG